MRKGVVEEDGGVVEKGPKQPLNDSAKISTPLLQTQRDEKIPSNS